MSLPVADAHAFLAPSAAARWVACPGSALMESRFPEAGDKEAAEEGTAAHWVFTQLLDGWAADVLLQGDRAPNGVPVDREMVEGAQMLVDDVRAVCAEFGIAVTSAVVEKRVAIPRVHPTANWGTPDVRLWVTFSDGRVFLFLWDFKYGHGIVEVFENWQLIDYVAGCLDEMRHVPEERITVVMRIVQPRAFHPDGPVREWRVRADQLRDYVFRLSMAADEATQAQPECKPQPAACENCTARHACEALQRAAYRGMDLARQAQASELTPAALGLEMRYLTGASKLMGARLTGLMAQAEALRLRGDPVPHWRTEATAAREKWTVPASEVIAMGAMLGAKLAKDPEVITPPQARAELKRAGIDPALIGVYAARPSGGLKLVADDGSDARKVFASS